MYPVSILIVKFKYVVELCSAVTPRLDLWQFWAAQLAQAVSILKRMAFLSLLLDSRVHVTLVGRNHNAGVPHRNFHSTTL